MPRRQAITKPKKPRKSTPSLKPSDKRSRFSIKSPRKPAAPRNPRP